MKLSWGIASVCGLVVLGGCGADRAARPAGLMRGVGVFEVGTPVSSRPVEVMGIAGTVELRDRVPATPASPPIFVTLGHAVAREPEDVCFGTYAANESSRDGDVSCQIRGREPFVLTLRDDFIPHALPARRFTALWGQTSSEVERIALIGPGATRVWLPLSAHRMFLVTFSPSARGVVGLVAVLGGGASITHVLTLPLTRDETGSWPRLRRRGAVSIAAVGENIVTRSYRQIIRQFGPPLSTFTRPHAVRCLYYDVVGHERGWRFCFHGEAMVEASGNQLAPPGVS